jgi:hypothetical protein
MSNQQIILVDSERREYKASGGIGITGDQGGSVPANKTDSSMAVFTVPNVTQGFRVYVALDSAGSVWASWKLPF